MHHSRDGNGNAHSRTCALGKDCTYLYGPQLTHLCAYVTHCHLILVEGHIFARILTCMPNLSRRSGTMTHAFKEGVEPTSRKTVSCAPSTLVSSFTAASCTPLRSARYTCHPRSCWVNSDLVSRWELHLHILPLRNARTTHTHKRRFNCFTTYLYLTSATPGSQPIHAGP